MRTAMATDTTKTLDDLADTADNMIEATGPTILVDNNSPYQIPEQVAEIELLRQEVAAKLPLPHSQWTHQISQSAQH